MGHRDWPVSRVRVSVGRQRARATSSLAVTRLGFLVASRAMDGTGLVVWPEDAEAVRLDDNDELAVEVAAAVMHVDDGHAGFTAGLDRVSAKASRPNLVRTHDGTCHGIPLP
jgi:hypothetical protein